MNVPDRILYNWMSIDILSLHPMHMISRHNSLICKNDLKNNSYETNHQPFQTKYTFGPINTVKTRQGRF